MSLFGMFDAGEGFPSDVTTIASLPFHHAGFVTSAIGLGDLFFERSPQRTMIFTRHVTIFSTSTNVRHYYYGVLS